jgi:hypothetical protein
MPQVEYSREGENTPDIISNRASHALERLDGLPLECHWTATSGHWSVTIDPGETDSRSAQQRPGNPDCAPSVCLKNGGTHARVCSIGFLAPRLWRTYQSPIKPGYRSGGSHVYTPELATRWASRAAGGQKRDL